MVSNIISIVFSSLFLIVVLGCATILSILILSRFYFPFQYLYMYTFSRWSSDDEHEWYEKAKLMLKEGKHIPLVYLCSYTEMQVYRSDEFKAFLKDYPLYFLAFPDGEVCLYTNDNIVICSFWKHILYHLMKIAGSTDPEKAVAYVIQEGKKVCEEHDAARKARIAQLEKEIAETERKVGK